MTTIALPRPIPTHSTGPDVEPPITPPHSLGNINRSVQNQNQHDSIPNKHMPECPAGPPKSGLAHTPPASPSYACESFPQRSLLFPTDSYVRHKKDGLCIFEIDSSKVAAAVDFVSRQPLPSTDLMFPWLHGLHPKNQLQQAFFKGRQTDMKTPPACTRGVLLVKTDGDLSRSRLKGAVSPDEFMKSYRYPKFIEADPQEGVSVRNFQIQTAKAALVSDIIVYGEDVAESKELAWEVAAAQARHRKSQLAHFKTVAEYNTFFCVSPYSEFEKNESNIVVVDSDGCATGKMLDFVQQERSEMWDMTRASEISHNVYMGPTPEQSSLEEVGFDVLIECSDLGQLHPSALRELVEADADSWRGARLHFEFPSSGSILPPTWSQDEANGIVETCKWIYHLSHGTRPAHNQGEAEPPESATVDSERRRQRRILIHCADGYTESTLLGIAYYSFSTGEPIPRAWLHLHTSKHRNFFAYPTDVSLLTSIAPQLLRESPLCAEKSPAQITASLGNEPKWLPLLDGSFPSRVLDYLYLGNLGHANNPGLLKELGIGQILSVGETASWRDGELDEWGVDNVYVVRGVQDNGIDPLMHEFQGCLDFINRGQQRGTATLVHCRVGVSRSATICIAEVMRAMNKSFPQAYCFVRARRLNVIIQPHLRFAYELLRWEERLQQCGDMSAPIKREMEWGEIAREIALMNRPYSR